MNYKSKYQPFKPEQNFCSPCGEKIYTYSFLDLDGNPQVAKKDIYQQIQSFENLTNYKETIRNYGLSNEFLDCDKRGIFCDITEFGDDIDDYRNAVSSLIKNLQEDINKIKSAKETLGASKTSGEPSVQSAESAEKNK